MFGRVEFTGQWYRRDHPLLIERIPQDGFADDRIQRAAEDGCQVIDQVTFFFKKGTFVNDGKFLQVKNFDAAGFVINSGKSLFLRPGGFDDSSVLYSLPA